MNISPTFYITEIERSHTIDKTRNGKAQIICKFRGLQNKNLVFRNKKKLKYCKSDSLYVYMYVKLDPKTIRSVGDSALNVARRNQPVMVASCET